MTIDVDVARTQLGELRAKARAGLGRQERVGVQQLRGLVGNSLHDAIVSVTDPSGTQVTTTNYVATAAPKID